MSDLDNLPPGTRVRVRPGAFWPPAEVVTVVVPPVLPFRGLIHVDDGTDCPPCVGAWAVEVVE